jgi:hypothetical protein
MKWFRRNIRTGSRLALFALAVQFVLSFGHFHLIAAQAAPDVQLQVKLGTAQGLAAELPSQAQQQPSNHDDPPSGESCAICAVLSMANQMLFATPALLLLPDAIELLFLVADAEFAHLSSPWSAFQSRAPPVS